MGTRWVVVGAGAIGGIVAARLHEAGMPTIAIARGAHLKAMRQGLVVASPGGRRTVNVPAYAINEVEPTPDDVILLCVKSQATGAALQQILTAFRGMPPVTCLQNGVANEPAAMHYADDVLGGQVFLPAVHLEPGVVVEHSVGTVGVIDVGAWPSGHSSLADELSQALSAAGFASEARENIAAWKYTKLLFNLSNIVGALCGPDARHGEVTQLAQAEARACYEAAGITTVSDEEFRARTTALDVRDVEGRPRPGNSTWQSLARKTGSIETDWLNGEVVVLGRQLGIDTPVNAALQRIAREWALAGRSPGQMTPDQLMALVHRQADKAMPAGS